ncbi:MAG: discoidin domain-containing protein, partial [Rhodanobacteraceae bacterium]
LQHPSVLHSISVRFLQSAGSWILLPRSVSFDISSDDKTWKTLQTVTLTPDPDDDRTFVHAVTFKSKSPISARYVRVVAANYGQSVHGLMPWLFADEIDLQ